MFKKKLFGSNIKPSCAYCRNAAYENEVCFCKKGQKYKNGNCKGFKYDPLMRVPKTLSLKKKFTADDFKL